MASADKGYVCTLDEKSLKKAKEELNEDPANRLGAVETFRKWILQQPHIKCPTDTAFLLCFLRVKYFSQLEARALLERYLLRRAKFANLYMNLDPCDPKILAAIDSGYIFVLPERDDEGRKVIIYKPGLMELSVKPFSKTDFFRTLACFYDYVYFMDENTSVNGTTSLIDISNYSLKVSTEVPMEDYKVFGDTWQNNIPARVKLILFYKGGVLVDVFFGMARFILSDKLQKRVKNHGDVLENVYKDIPMRCLPVEYLPDDYKGPNAGTERQIIGSMASPDKAYVCTLDEKSLKKAKEELNEDPKNRLGAVETFRKWILEQHHIKCPTDTAFLLCFLRVRYFSQLEARELLERYLVRRAKFAKLYMNLDPCDPKIMAGIDSGYLLVLPEKDDEGRKVFIYKPCLMELTIKPFSKTDFFRIIACVYDYVYFMDERTCVNGSVCLVDMTHYSLKVSTEIPLEDLKVFGETWQNNFPARVKMILLYKGGVLLDVFFGMIKMIFSEKLQKRVKNAGQILESVYKDIPKRCLPVEYLPDDYKGPNAGTERQIIESMKRDLTRPEVRARLQYLSSDKWKVDKTQKRSNDAPSASFRKLNID